jgi:4-amino-4-deoxy-L-arabinose transferase-like glycosyltransferase
MSRFAARLSSIERDKCLLSGVVFVAFLLRVWPVLRPGLFWVTNVNPWDATGYIQLSEGLRHGCGFARWVDLTCSAPEILRVPGYPSFVALVKNLRAVVALQAIMGAMVCLFLGIFLRKRWGIAAALAAALAIAFDQPTLVWTSQIMTESLFQLLIVAAILLELRVISTGTTRSQSLGSLAVAVLLSLALMVKSVGQLVVPLAALAFLLPRERWRKRLLLAALPLVIPVLVVLCWTIRNNKLMGAPVYALEESGQLYLFKSASVVAYSTGKNFDEVQQELQQELWRRLRLPADVNLNVWGPVSPLQGRSAVEMARRGEQILLRHPLIYALLTAKSFIYLAVTPGLGDLQKWLKPSESEARQPGSLSLPNKTVIAGKLGALGHASLSVLSIVIVYWILIALVWGGVTRAIWKCRHLPSRDLVSVLLPLCVALVLMLAASGPEGGARFRVPAMPFLDLVAAIGWFGQLRQPGAVPAANDHAELLVRTG